MLIPFGILSSAGGVGVVGDYELIDSEILTTAVSSVVFDVSSLGSTYKHLQIRGVAKSSVASSGALLRFNNVTTTSYAYHFLRGNGTNVASAAATSQDHILIPAMMSQSTTANVFGAGIVDILDFSSTTKNTTTRTLEGQVGSTLRIGLASGLFINTAAITTASLTAISGNFVTGSRFSLYGIRG